MKLGTIEGGGTSSSLVLVMRMVTFLKENLSQLQHQKKQ